MDWEPRAYQERAVPFFKDNKSFAGLLDMGLGKTVCTLTAIAELLDECDIRASLIIAPVRVIHDVWEQEARKWNHTKHLKFSKITGSERERISALSDETADVFLINYENLIWLCDWMLQNQPPFDMVVFDESSMMKSPSAKRFKRIKPFMPFFHRKGILTGTPAAEGLHNLWSQYYLLDQGKRLGQYITHFKAEHFQALDTFGRKLRIRPGSDKKIHAAISDITLTLRAEDNLDLPELMLNTIKLTLPPKLMERYKELEDEFFIEFGKVKVEAMNEASLSAKLRQFTSGALYDENKEVMHIHDFKMDALDEVVEGMDGNPLLVAYEFRHEAMRFAKKYPDAPILGGGVKQAYATKAIVDWNKGKIPLMFVQPQSIGHGVNLQYGGRHLLWYTTVWSGERYQQTIKRLHRQGQTGTVMVHHLVCANTTDTIPLAAQRMKGKSQDNLLKALVAYREKGACVL